MESADLKDEILRKRFWLLKNLDWFLDEAVFHREMKEYFKLPKMRVWSLNEDEGKAKVYEITE